MATQAAVEGPGAEYEGASHREYQADADTGKGPGGQGGGTVGYLIGHAMALQELFTEKPDKPEQGGNKDQRANDSDNAIQQFRVPSGSVQATAACLLNRLLQTIVVGFPLVKPPTQSLRTSGGIPGAGDYTGL